MRNCKYCESLGPWAGLPRCENHPSHSLMASPIGRCSWHETVGVVRWLVSCARCETVVAEATVIPGEGRTVIPVKA